MTGTDASCLKACVEGLDQTARYVVLMFFADDLTPAEIGLVLDIPLTHVQNTLSSFRESATQLLKAAALG
jgi:DNA-directed RNA polymerase specialized sigma24 family protein